MTSCLMSSSVLSIELYNKSNPNTILILGRLYHICFIKKNTDFLLMLVKRKVLSSFKEKEKEKEKHCLSWLCNVFTWRKLYTFVQC